MCNAPPKVDLGAIKLLFNRFRNSYVHKIPIHSKKEKDGFFVTKQTVDEIQWKKEARYSPDRYVSNLFRLQFGSP